MNRTLWVALVGIALSAATPAVARALRAGSSARCAEDGARLDPRRAVDVEEADGRAARLCGIECLERRLHRTDRPAPRSVRVHDEDTGALLDADAAWFVRSAVVDRATGDRTHAFATEAAARRHAEAFHGRVLPGPGLPALRAAKEAR